MDGFIQIKLYEIGINNINKKIIKTILYKSRIKILTFLIDYVIIIIYKEGLCNGKKENW